MEMALIGEAAFRRNLGEGQLILRQKAERKAQPLIKDPAVRWNANRVLERFQEVIVRHVQPLCDVAKGNGMIELG